MQAWIHDAVRTPRGKARPDGGLASQKPYELVGALVAALQSRGASPREVESLILGCVGQIGDQGGNIALVSKLHAGIDESASAFTLNNYCVSGLTAIGHGALQVAGQHKAVLGGGVEMLSRVPFMADKAGYYTDSSFPKRSRYVPVVLAADRLAEAQDRRVPSRSRRWRRVLRRSLNITPRRSRGRSIIAIRLRMHRRFVMGQGLHSSVGRRRSEVDERALECWLIRRQVVIRTHPCSPV